MKRSRKYRLKIQSPKVILNFSWNDWLTPSAHLLNELNKHDNNSPKGIGDMVWTQKCKGQRNRIMHRQTMGIPKNLPSASWQELITKVLPGGALYAHMWSHFTWETLGPINMGK